MAQKIRLTLIDDIDGSEADETVSFVFDGISYEIDLSNRNAEQFRPRAIVGDDVAAGRLRA
jgi:Lsr2